MFHLFALVIITCLGTLSEIVSSLSFSRILDSLYRRLALNMPFGLVAAVIGVFTAMLIDLRVRFYMRFILDGLLTGIVAGILAFIAVLAQSNANIESILGVIIQDPDELRRNPGLKVIPFVVPLVFAMGLCIGLIIPEGFRRYGMGHEKENSANTVKYMG